MENKTGKYFKYAIGEIILVVIGILIALSINNWNQAIQTQRSNRLYLTKMLKDLDFNNRRLNNIIYTYSKDNVYPSLKEANKDCDSIIKLTYLGLKTSNLEFLAKAVPYQGGSLLNINDNTYNELLNTGKLYGLGSEHLIEVIQNYYKLCERETEYQNQNNTDIGRGLIKFEDSFNLLFEDYNRHPSKFNLIDYPFYLNSKSKEYKNYQSGLLLIREGQTTNKKKMLNIIKETEIISKTIKSYLASDDKIL